MSPRTKVVVATTVMLSFISFWRAAAIVLSDLASSAYYAGGIAETQIGKSAPWFILGIMLFSYAVRAVYVESCSMFVRGGVYKVVHEAMGGTLAKISVSALMFDYILTGPISGVSAGLYLAGIVNEIGGRFHITAMHFNPPTFAAGFAVLATVYFWRKNILGMHESSEKALRIMQITTVMVVILVVWCLLTMLLHGYQPVPLPVGRNLHLSEGAVGWLKGTIAPTITAVAILIGLGHSLLAMSGFETLAQVYRELASPKLQNLKRAGNVIFLYSMLFTSLASFFAVMLIPDSERPKYLDNLLGGLSIFLAGPPALTLLFHVFVVVVGTLILAGAVNTAIIGSNGVLNRVAEDGVLPNWFRKPHRKFGTSNRLINTVVILQIFTIMLSRGDVNLLGEAYAFGVVWSFSFNALSVLVLRFKQPENREWKVPLNIRVGKTEIPVGLGLITLFLFTLAVINVFTKELATIAGISFTLAFFLVFTISERINKKNHARGRQDLEQFRLDQSVEVSSDQVHARAGNVLVAVRNPFHLEHLEKTLAKTDTRKVDIVVLSIHRVTAAASGEFDLNPDQIFAAAEQDLFTRVVTMAEKAGKHVELLAVAAADPWLGMMQTAQRLQSSRVVTGLSPRFADNPSEQGKVVGAAWEMLEAPRPSLSLEIVLPDPEQSVFFNLGPHPPRLWPEDIDLVHRLWLELSSRGNGANLHHRDIVGVALSRLEKELHSEIAGEVLSDIDAEVRQHPPERPVDRPKIESTTVAR
ncbi:MAG TPA: APC family permease [Bryobacteraceae bacterium]|jgi:amino acid transporter|nr:APC family permease [Bryobacteraceae bacterium]